VPLGFGAHHWRASTTERGDLFLTIHELDMVGASTPSRQASLEVLHKALSTARWLESVARVDFVVGPLPDASGSVLRPVADKFALSVYPWLDAEPVPDPDGSRAVQLIVRLHQVTNHMPDGLVRVEDFLIPHRHALEVAIAHLAEPWHTGPYAEPARKELRRHLDSVRSLMQWYDRVAAETIPSRTDWVLTHGEPAGPNLLETTGGTCYLVDWDSVMIAPRERDLWELPCTKPVLTTYGAPIEAERLRLYKAWYTLAELAVYLAVFRSPHTGDQNDNTSWENFQRFLPTP
jgi:spectinomycin phosphotransferase